MKGECSLYGGEETIFSSDSPELLARTLVITISPALTVDLVEDPAVSFGLDSKASYSARSLFDPEASVPQRAATMLGYATHGFANS